MTDRMCLRLHGDRINRYRFKKAHGSSVGVYYIFYLKSIEKNKQHTSLNTHGINHIREYNLKYFTDMVSNKTGILLYVDFCNYKVYPLYKYIPAAHGLKAPYFIFKIRAAASTPPAFNPCAVGFLSNEIMYAAIRNKTIPGDTPKNLPLGFFEMMGQACKEYPDLKLHHPKGPRGFFIRYRRYRHQTI